MAKKMLETVQKTAKGLHRAGVMDATTLRELDTLCLPPVKTLTAAQIKRLRLKNKDS